MLLIVLLCLSFALVTKNKMFMLMLMFSNTYYTLACRTEGGFWLISGKWRERETSAKSDKRASKGTRKLNTFHAHAAPFALVSRVTLRSLSS